MRNRSTIRSHRRLGALACILVTSLAASAGFVVAQSSVETPGARGDQLIFFFDARTDRVPFLTISNPSNSAVTVEVAFHPQGLSGRLGAEIVRLAAGANAVVDPTDAAGGAAAGVAGLAVVTPIAGESDATPVVPPQPLVGGYTLANLRLSAGFGENPMGRIAVTGSGSRAAAGATVDGNAVSYQTFEPPVLAVPVYFNPGTLAAAADDGNRVILVAFDDAYGTPFDVSGASSSMDALFVSAEGQVITETAVAVNGVLSTDLQAIAGSTNLGESGKVFFTIGAGADNVFGVFSQSLQTFASGGRMPALAEAPDLSMPMPTPAPTPTVIPTIVPPTQTPDPFGAVCGNGVVEGLEDCDGLDIDGLTCEDIVGGSEGCGGLPACNDDCTFDVSACQCTCEGDFDCDIEIDCFAVVDECELIGACEGGFCVTNPIGNDAICNGFDPEDEDLELTRCEL